VIPPAYLLANIKDNSIAGDNTWLPRTTNLVSNSFKTVNALAAAPAAVALDRTVEISLLGTLLAKLLT
jgi:hypothetical protein